MQAAEALAERLQFGFAERRLDSREYLALCKADVVGDGVSFAGRGGLAAPGSNPGEAAVLLIKLHMERPDQDPAIQIAICKSEHPGRFVHLVLLKLQEELAHRSQQATPGRNIFRQVRVRTGNLVVLLINPESAGNFVQQPIDPPLDRQVLAAGLEAQHIRRTAVDSLAAGENELVSADQLFIYLDIFLLFLHRFVLALSSRQALAEFPLMLLLELRIFLCKRFPVLLDQARIGLAVDGKDLEQAFDMALHVFFRVELIDSGALRVGILRIEFLLLDPFGALDHSLENLLGSRQASSARRCAGWRGTLREQARRPRKEKPRAQASHPGPRRRGPAWRHRRCVSAVRPSQSDLQDEFSPSRSARAGVRRISLLAGDAAARRLAERGTVEVFAQVHQGEEGV